MTLASTRLVSSWRSPRAPSPGIPNALVRHSAMREAGVRCRRRLRHGYSSSACCATSRCRLKSRSFVRGLPTVSAADLFKGRFAGKVLGSRRGRRFETERRDNASNFGCDVAQGYLVCHPVPLYCWSSGSRSDNHGCAGARFVMLIVVASIAALYCPTHGRSLSPLARLAPRRLCLVSQHRRQS